MVVKMADDQTMDEWAQSRAYRVAERLKKELEERMKPKADDRLADENEFRCMPVKPYGRPTV